MTADHPTREERYAAVIVAHGEHYDSDCGMYFGCDCGWDNGTDEHNDGYAAHVAAALVAADPAPAQPDAALSREWAEAFLREWSRPYFGNDSGDAVAAVLRAARAAQPAPAPEVSRGVAEVDDPNRGTRLYIKTLRRMNPSAKVLAVLDEIEAELPPVDGESS